MPIYEYRCLGCGHESEVVSAHPAPDKLKCGKCGGEMKKRMSVATSIWKEGKPSAGR